MGNFYIITSSHCGPCLQFKKSGMFDRLVKYLFENVQNVNVFWYESNDGSYTGYEIMLDSKGNIQKESVKINQNVIDMVSFFPQIIYQRIMDGTIFEETFTANNEKDWEKLLAFVERNPDIFSTFDGIDNDDFVRTNNNDFSRSSPSYRKSPRRRSSPKRVSPRRSPKTQKNRKIKWMEMK